MSYSKKIRTAVKSTPSRGLLGLQLGKLAVYHELSVREISKATGASRTTVYNWLSGKGVTNAYHEKVRGLIEGLKKHKS